MVAVVYFIRTKIDLRKRQDLLAYCLHKCLLSVSHKSNCHCCWVVISLFSCWQPQMLQGIEGRGHIVLLMGLIMYLLYDIGFISGL